MFLRIENIGIKKIVGKSIKTTFSDNGTFELWRSFMPHRNEIKNRVNSELISLQIFDKGYHPSNIDINSPFVKWAAAEVSEFSQIPEGMAAYTLRGGLYAVFLHKGTPKDFFKTHSFIYYIWLPNSSFKHDDREHFEILGEKYKNNSADSEEEIYIPIKLM